METHCSGTRGRGQNNYCSITPKKTRLADWFPVKWCSAELCFYLESRVHEACVAQVAETTQARLRLWLSVVIGGAVRIVAPQSVEKANQLMLIENKRETYGRRTHVECQPCATHRGVNAHGKQRAGLCACAVKAETYISERGSLTCYQRRRCCYWVCSQGYSHCLRWLLLKRYWLMS